MNYLRATLNKTAKAFARHSCTAERVYLLFLECSNGERLSFYVRIGF